MNIAQHILILSVRLYRWVISPAKALLFGPLGRCRFTPSCSQYALDAVRTHGALRGSGLAVRRICRCHPWGGCGEDPVPAAKPGNREPKAEGQSCRVSGPGGACHSFRILRVEGQRHS